jgi:polar amino acid transport system substrate-binding protein
MRGILMSVRVKRVGSEECRPLPVRPQFQTRCTALRDAMGQERPLSGFHCAARRSTFRELQRCLDGNLHMSNARQVMRRVVVSAALLCIWDGRHAMADPVKIAYADVFPPFTELKDGKAEGLAVEIVRAAAGRAGIEVEFVAVPFEQVQRTLEDGRADAVFPLSITPERLVLFDFSDPFLVTGGALFVRAPNSTPQGLGSLADKIVVTPRTGPLAAYIQKNAPELKLVITKDYEESLGRLVERRADVAALGFHVGISIAGRLYPGQVTLPQNMFTELPFAVAVAKGQKAQFLAQLNAGITAIRADGTWQRINDQWMGK